MGFASSHIPLGISRVNSTMIFSEFELSNRKNNGRDRSHSAATVFMNSPNDTVFATVTDLDLVRCFSIRRLQKNIMALITVTLLLNVR